MSCQGKTDADPLKPSLEDTQLTIMKDWCLRLHRQIFDWACFNAYDLKHHPERCATHLFVVRLQRTSKAAAGPGKKIGKIFRVMDASLVSREALMLKGELSPDVLQTIAKSDQELAGREGETRPKARILVLWDTRCLWTSGYWDKEEMEVRSEDPNWKAILQSVTGGKKGYEMVHGNPIRK